MALSEQTGYIVPVKRMLYF